MSEVISPFSRKGTGRVSEREKPKSCSGGAIGQKLQIEGELGMMFLHVRRVDGQASNPGQLSPFSLQVARYVRILALSIERHFLLELALPSSFSPSKHAKWRKSRTPEASRKGKWVFPEGFPEG